jgi:tight adherence protein B
MAALAQAGIPVPFDRWCVDAPEGPISSTVSCALAVAREAGAPIATVLGQVAKNCDRLAFHADMVAQSVAGPRLAARIIGVLPGLAVPLTSILGFDVVGVLIGSVTGWILIALAAFLTWAGARWSKKMVARALFTAPSPGLYPRLVAISISVGIGVTSSRNSALRALVDADLLSTIDGEEVRRSDQFLESSSRLGIPVAAGLRALDDQCVDEVLQLSSLKARELGERLLLPLGTCTLPAFLALGVVPAVISVVSSTRLGI